MYALVGCHTNAMKRQTEARKIRRFAFSKTFLLSSFAPALIQLTADRDNNGHREEGKVDTLCSLLDDLCDIFIFFLLRDIYVS